MAFYIEFKTGISTEKMQFHLPVVRAIISDLRHMGKHGYIVSIHADGDELELIRNRFDNLPIRKGGLCIWRGDMANFICENFTD